MDTRREGDARSREAAPDAAVFSVAPVARRKRSLPVLAATALGVAVVGVAIAGVIGRVQPVARTAVVAKAPVAIDVPGIRTQSQRLAEGPFGPLDGRTGVTPGRTARSLITVDATRSGGLLFVHGDVFTRRAVGVLIVVTVADGRDRTLLIQSVVLPGGSTAFRLGPNDRFDLSVELPEAPTMQAATVAASAYDEAGAVIASAQTRLDQVAIEAPAAYRM